ncbi:MAG: hypothetical protein EDM05_042135 [Leptolyngbya sp. IPPAS B-1204]|nr:MAG: hypothetical protein EDM05_14365 [Leptolyngbya sp. IPPAS B-1204]
MRTPMPPPSDHLRSVRIGLAMVLTGSVFLATGSLAVRFYWLVKVDQQQRVEQQHQAILARVEYLKAAGDHQRCIRETQQIPVESLFHSRAIVLQDQCQRALTTAVLNRAQGQANAGQLKDAISEVQTISDSAVAAQVQQLVWQWSNQILQVAEGYYRDSNGRFEDALKTAGAITPDNPLYSEAQNKIRGWQQEWLNNQSRWQIVEAAFKAHQYETALLQAQQISHPYWSRQVAPIVQAIYREQAAPQPSPPGRSESDSIDTIPAGGMDDVRLPIYLLLPLMAGAMVLLAGARRD